MAGKHIFRGVVEVPNAKTNEEAVNLGQVKDLVNRYNKEPVRVATTDELSGTYSAGVLTLDAPLTVLDGVTLVENDAILVKDQVDATQNGVYLIDATGSILTRRDDFAEGKTILNNTFVNVMEGTDNKDTRWTIVSDGVLTCGTSIFKFIKDIDVTQTNVRVAKATITPDGVAQVFNIAHNFQLGDEYGYILKILDISHNEIFVDNVPKVGDEKNAITLTFDSVPEVTDKFTAYILGLE